MGSNAAKVALGMGAQVTVRLYPDLGHTINTEELHYAQEIIEGAAGLR